VIELMASPNNPTATIQEMGNSQGLGLILQDAELHIL
jgi:hypothetical protein